MSSNQIKIFRLISFTIFFNLILIISALNAQRSPILKFDQSGKFKIVQFTDVHLKIENKQRSDSVINTIKFVIDKEKPDMVVFTGDVVTSNDVKKAWAAVTEPIIDAKVPWAVVFGNHDHEHGLTNAQIMKYLESLPLNQSKSGPKNISGSGNYVLEIKGFKSNNTKALLYCFDSNAYTGKENNKELGEYDWIKNDQIQWYRNESIRFTKNNKGNPYPALAFFHIPLPEYNTIKAFSTTIGDKDEDVASPVINSGMYCAILESKDIMGVFCGHDHNNNYIGTLNDIALAYGCKTGKDSYGKLSKGGRVIVLYEGERKFDTWITTTDESGKYFVKYPESFKSKYLVN
ncbi:MAG: metallophosphoesterase family protein [Bacteroidota bacterium]|nr:metallophosphoesterase family protein [Bacteroidota bacterium]